MNISKLYEKKYQNLYNTLIMSWYEKKNTNMIRKHELLDLNGRERKKINSVY